MRERKRNRLKDHNYSQEGYYFVTICTKDREEWFGNVDGDEMRLNKFGEIARNFWAEITGHFKFVGIDEFSVMPNHAHGILIIEGDMVGNAYMRSHQRNAFMHSLQDRTKMLLSKIIQQYKASVTRKINSSENVFDFRWQKSFYDHVIRNDKSLDNLRRYIINNPLKWELDIENRKGDSPHKNCVDYYREIIGKEGGNAYMRSLHR
jgi:REP element-mobilizing transposase RayT